jgi:hypothetical protein
VVVQVDENGTASTATSAAAVVVNVNDAPSGTFTIAGTARRAKRSPRGPCDRRRRRHGPRSYQWEVQTAPDTWTKIDGATDSTFTLTQATVGKSVRAVVSFTDDKGTPESSTATSSRTSRTPTSRQGGSLGGRGHAQGGPDRQHGRPRVRRRRHRAGRPLLPVAGADANGAWVNLEGASGNQPFTLTEAQLGRPLRAVVSFTDGDGKAETVLGTPSAPVAAAGNSAPTGTLALDDGPGAAPAEDSAIMVDARA